MRQARVLFLLLSCLALLAACTGGPPKRVFPPQASIQELRVVEGNWQIDLRIRNFSTVAMQFEQVEGELQINGRPAGRFAAQPALAVGPGSAEILTLAFAADTEARSVVASALEHRRGIRYRLSGRIRSSEPKREHDYDYESALDPVPGLAGVLR